LLAAIRGERSTAVGQKSLVGRLRYGRTASKEPGRSEKRQSIEEESDEEGRGASVRKVLQEKLGGGQ
jgi:hypothetical protein